MAFSDYSSTPGSNTSIAGINIAENCSPANLNNALRQLMADAKVFSNDIGDGSGYQPIDALLTALAALTTAADKGLYFTGSDTAATFDLTSFGRTLAGLASYEALRTALGCLTVTSSSLTNPGYRVLSDGTKEMWGTGSIGANTTGTITYPASFTSWAVCVVSGSPSSPSVEGGVAPFQASGLSTQGIVNSGGSTAFYSWRAFGV